jgi:hypothetical protein
MSDGLAQARTIAGLLQKRYCGPLGLLARKVDAARGRIVDPRPAISDLGDYVQYVFLLGQATGDEVLCAWSREQVRRTVELAQGNDGLVRVFAAETGIPGRLLRAAFSALPATDALWGIAEIARLTDDPDMHCALQRFARGVLRFACGRYRLPVYAMWRVGARTLKLPISNPMLAGMWIESLVVMRPCGMASDVSFEAPAEDRRTHPPDGDVAWAVEMARGFAEHQAFARAGLFPLRCATSPWGDRLLPVIDMLFRLRGRPPSGSTVMSKGSAHLVFGLLAVYRLTGEAWLRDVLERWKRTVLGTFRVPDGRFAEYWSGVGPPREVTLAGNNTVIEALLDLAYDLSDEEALSAVEAAAHAWLVRRGRVGAIPNRDGGPALLDAHVDLAVNLLKLAELTRQTRWLEAADWLETQVLARYAVPFGLAWCVDSTTGRILESVIETKFLGLFLKIPLLRAALARGERIFADVSLRRLATDR